MNTTSAATVWYALAAAIVCAEKPASIDLAGQWTVRLDPDDIGVSAGWAGGFQGDPIQLPGTLAEAGIGEPLELEPELSKAVLSGLHARHRYVGPAWYRREIDLPAEWSHRSATLSLERVIWKSTVWVNGKKAGSADSLCTPHRHAVGQLLRPGANTVVVRVDNRPQVDLGEIGHAYTDWTQTIWNGLIGRLELRIDNPVRIDRIGITPQPRDGRLPVSVRINNTTDKPFSGEVELSLVGPSGERLSRVSTTAEIQPGDGEVSLDLPADKTERWSEFEAALYRVECSFAGDNASTTTGVREVQTVGRELRINGRRSFLRGTLECCIFPKTGYPPTDRDGWDKVFKTVREYGLNHVRFHSWCPPEAAFASADHWGVYLQIELPNWTFKMGQVPAVDAYLEAEGERILREYGHHPSFIMMSLGNELAGDFAAIDDLLMRLKQKAPHLLFTSTSYTFTKRGEAPGPADEFFITQKSRSGWVRGQGFLNQTRPNTDSDYREGLSSIDVPLISHEVGQYHVYPNLAELPKYDGALRAVNFEAIAGDLSDKGRLDRAADYTGGSGRLAAELYKEDIERALRTRDLAGIQLLDLHDFPGQSTATIGLLDAFWDSKGVVSPEGFRRFCGPVTPLARMPQRVWRTGERFVADLELANFGSAPIRDAKLSWKLITEEGRSIASGEFKAKNFPLGNGLRIGRVEADLSQLQEACRLTLAVSLDGTPHQNQWNAWVYPEAAPRPETPTDLLITSDYGKPLFDALAAGRRVLFLPERESIAHPLDGRFVPVFWSPVHFESQPGSVGALIDAGHPALSEFPTEGHSDWQWWELLAKSTAVDATALGPDFKTVVQFIDKFDRNAMPAAVWEASVGPGRLLVCTLDVATDLDSRPVAAQLRRSLLRYAGSDSFAPGQKLEPAQLAALFQERAYRVRVASGVSHTDYPASNLDDGDDRTFWHTDWANASYAHPYLVRIELERPAAVAGIEYVPRQDKPVGRVAEYRVETLEPSGSWRVAAEGALNDSAAVQTIAFDEPIETTRVRLVALSEVSGKPHCAIAELRPLLSDETESVDELGLIEGFNTVDE